jgi:DNA processing protein
VSLGTGSGRTADPDRWARAALSRLTEPGDQLVGARVSALGAVAVLARIRAGTFEGERGERYAARLPGLDVEGDLAAARRAGARLVVPGDEEWPEPVDDLGAARPLALWVSGAGRLDRATRRAVSVVGARACTSYGERVAADLGAGLVQRGWTVVSGAAFGIDAAAHRGALAVDGVTVAVLAGGVDVVYPRSHDRLLAQVRERGLVVSELPPGSRPTRSRFLMRNRVIAALGRGTVVVEAALRSGARRTADDADQLSRSVMAVPGPVTSTMSAGCHEMVRTRGAALVTDTADVLDQVGELGVDAAPQRRGDERPQDQLDETGMAVLDAVPLRRAAEPGSVARVAGLDVPTVLRTLAELGRLGLAHQEAGRWRRTAFRRGGA